MASRGPRKSAAPSLSLFDQPPALVPEEASEVGVPIEPTESAAPPVRPRTEPKVKTSPTPPSVPRAVPLRTSTRRTTTTKTKPKSASAPPTRKGGGQSKRSVPTPPPPISGYRAMWLFALFDLPVDTKTARRDYTRFRNLLLGEGFTMLQFSVYARFCRSEDSSDAMRRRIRSGLPSGGQVRLVAITDTQFGKQEIFHGKSRRKAEEEPPQLLLF